MSNNKTSKIMLAKINQKQRPSLPRFLYGNSYTKLTCWYQKEQVLSNQSEISLHTFLPKYTCYFLIIYAGY